MVRRKALGVDDRVDSPYRTGGRVVRVQSGLAVVEWESGMRSVHALGELERARVVRRKVEPVEVKITHEGGKVRVDAPADVHVAELLSLLVQAAVLIIKNRVHEQERAKVVEIAKEQLEQGAK